MMTAIRVCFGAIAAMMCLTANTSTARASSTCLAGVSKDNLSAKTAYQTQLAKLIVQHDASLKELSNLNAAVQIAKAKARHFKILHLLEVDPDRINTTQGLSRFSNFRWSRQETADLVGQDEDFAEINQRVDQLQSQSKGHPDWSKFRALFKEKLARSADHTRLLANLKAGQRKAEENLKQCGD